MKITKILLRGAARIKTAAIIPMHTMKIFHENALSNESLDSVVVVTESKIIPVLDFTVTVPESFNVIEPSPPISGTLVPVTSTNWYPAGTSSRIS